MRGNGSFAHALTRLALVNLLLLLSCPGPNAKRGAHAAGRGSRYG